MEEWPNNNCDFNRWYHNLTEFAKILENHSGFGWWIYDSELKYLDIRVDTRGTRFVVLITDREGNKQRIDPMRVVRAIEKCKESR